MKKKKKWKHCLHQFSYENRKLSRTVLVMKKSLDEVCVLLNPKCKL